MVPPLEARDPPRVFTTRRGSEARCGLRSKDDDNPLNSEFELLLLRPNAIATFTYGLGLLATPNYLAAEHFTGDPETVERTVTLGCPEHPLPRSIGPSSFALPPFPN